MKIRSLFTKSINTVLSVSMALTLLTPILIASADEPGKSSDEERSYIKSETNRETLNFNRDWKFYLGDAAEGQTNDFDDTSWTDIALPHTFDLPYNMSSSFYVGYGWYRKRFEVKQEDLTKTFSLDFEGSFQITELYVNEKLVGTHEGGYTGFTFDISDYLQAGENMVAVRVNNIWQPDVSPRAGDHQFTGGIYRDVTLTIADPVHVPWYGTFVTTPDLLNPAFDPSAQNVLNYYTDEVAIRENLKNKRSNVRVETEVANDSAESQRVQVKQEVVDKEGNLKASFESNEQVIAANAVYNFDTTSEQIQNIELWDTENPYVYTVYTTVYRDGKAVDLFESSLGFRCAQYKNDGFYLNGEKVLLDGANVHQDHGGWGNAVTNEGFYRDVQMIKDSGMNFIRGSHYPHDPAFADACDEIGILFWSESVFWGMGGCAGEDDPATMTAADWFKDAYPQNPADEEAFEESCKQALTEMIRVNRNHPSIINWSMGNEVFFTNSATQEKAKSLVNELRNLSHTLDPTRKAGMGGVQREGYDSLEICDIAGYNGDGGKFTNLKMPNIVAEYGSKTADRPGEYRPFYDQIQGGNENEYQLKPHSAGLVLWCAFHHGTIGGDGLAKMGMIDYYRLPLKSWYWYREKNLGIAPEESIEGIATKLQLSTSETIIKNDGTKDTQLIVTMMDDEENWVHQSPPVTLTVVEGPGVFPTGKSYTFIPNNTIRDGKAAIEFRSYYSGTTVIEASAPGVPKTQIRLDTTDTTNGFEGIEPDDFMVTEKKDTTDKIAEPIAYGKNNVALQRPAFPSSNLNDAGLASDQNVDTQWVAEVAGAGQYWMLDSEFEQYFYKAKLDFKDTPFSYKIEISDDKTSDNWTTVAIYDRSTGSKRPFEESLHGVKGRYVKVTFHDVPEDAYAHLADIAVYGNTASQSPAYVSERVYISDLTPDKEIVQGWGGMQPGIDVSIEGKPITIAGTVYNKGLGLHANSEAVYNLDAGYSRFQSIIGIDDETNGDGDAIFRIYATIEGQSEQLIYEQQVTGGMAIPVDVSVSRVKTLRLVTDSNGTNGSDHTDWADAKLLGAVRDMSINASQYKAILSSSSEELQAGQKFDVSMQLENINHTSNTYTAALALYDQNGTLCDITMQNGYLLKGKQASIQMNLQIPENFINGEARVMVFDTNTLKPYTQIIHIATKDQMKNDQAKASSHTAEILNQLWVFVDGEDSRINKTGNWSLWNAGSDSGAYMGTETYVEANNWQNSSLSYTFTGNKVRIGAKYDQSQVGAEIYIDDVLVDTIHTTSTTNVNEYKQAWESSILNYGKHTIKIVPIGKFGLDFISYGEGAEVEVVDKQALQLLIEQAQTYKAENYTTTSWNAFQTALKAAVAVNKETTSTKEQVAQAISRLQELILNLKELTPIGNMSKLLNAFQKTLDFIQEDDRSAYEEERVKVVADTFYNGYILYTQQRVEQDRLNQAASSILSALEQLVQSDNPNLQQSLLKAVIDKAQTLIHSGVLENVNKKVMKHFNVALDTAVKVYANKEATDQELLSAWQNLADAMHYLDFSANTMQLSELVKLCNDMDLSIYQDDANMKEFIAARTFAESVLANENSLDESLTAAFTRLTDAKANLKLLEDAIDTTLIDYMIHKADTALADIAKYNTTAESWKLFTDALSAAKVAKANQVSQAAVDEAATILANAYENIRLIANEETLNELTDFIRLIDSIHANDYSTETYAYFMNAKARIMDMIDMVYNETLTMKEYEEAQMMMVAVIVRIENDKITTEPGSSGDVIEPSIPVEAANDVKTPLVNQGTTKPITEDTTQIGMLFKTLLCGFILSVFAYRKRSQKQ